MKHQLHSLVSVCHNLFTCSQKPSVTSPAKYLDSKKFPVCLTLISRFTNLGHSPRWMHKVRPMSKNYVAVKM